MNPISMKKRLLSVFGGLLLTLAGASSAFADDSEIFLGNASASVTPNILFVLDTSGSMDSKVYTMPDYDPNKSYSGGSCDHNKIYFANSRSKVPTSCSSTILQGSFESKYFTCVNGDGLTSVGFYADQFVQWRPAGPNWASTLTSSTSRREVVCRSDWPGGDPVGPNATQWPTDSGSQWTTDPKSKNSYWNNNGTGGAYVFYTGNYIDYQNSTPATVAGTRMSVVKTAAKNLINSLTNANVGIMRYANNGGSGGDTEAQGGFVAYQVSPVSTNRKGLTDAIDTFSAAGWTPLSETLYEAYQYYSGGDVVYGDKWSSGKSVKESRVGGVMTSTKYQSPITSQCQKNFIVYLTDGLPTQDNQADTAIQTLTGESCDDTSKAPYNGYDYAGLPIPGGWGPGDKAGQCMATLAKKLQKDMNSTLTGTQNVALYTIGFGDDPALAAASGWLARASDDKHGNGEFYSAGDLQELQAVLTNIVSNIQKTSTTFTAPTVAVNAFNRTQTLNDLYVSVFQPAVGRHWPGNVKKYGVKNAKIIGADGQEAVDPATGFFRDDAQSIWSASADGNQVVKGGAANKIPDPDVRKVYTYIGANPTAGSMVDLSQTGTYNYVVSTDNTLLTNTVLGVATATQHDNAIAYARGVDLKDEDNDGATNDARHAMGDPVHAQPAVVIYGGTTASKNVDDAVVYSVTNDGFLHAFDVATGVELWSFIPQDLLPHMATVYANNPTNPRVYGLDGNVKALKYDTNNDGIVDKNDNDRVILYFGQGRGGNHYYAIDVTEKNKPKYMWTIGPNTAGMANIGQAWSTPQITRVNIGSIASTAQNKQKLVLLFAGGYDPVEENVGYQTGTTVGNALYMVDAIKGTVLWSAGPSTSTTANLKLARMDHSIPSDLTVIDFEPDGYADRIYVGDMAGQVWRFDVNNGPTATATSIVTGGVIASLGTKEDATKTTASNRRFYNAPDISSVRRRGIMPFFNIAIGSGYRGHPLDTTVQDRFYSIRDYMMFDKKTQAWYNDETPANRTIIKDDTTGLVDITASVSTTTVANPVAVAPDALGWKLLLNLPSSTWLGEKVLANSTTFNEQILFPTYTPNTAGAPVAGCSPGTGTNRLYQISLLDGSGTYTTLAQTTGIAPPLAFLFPKPDPDPNSDPPTDPNNPPPDPPPGSQQPVVCMSGAEVLGACKNFDSLIKTYWRDLNAN